MREFKEKILAEEQAGRGEAAKTKVETQSCKNISLASISGEHEARDDEEQEQPDRVDEEDEDEQRGEGKEGEEGEGGGRTAEASKQEAGK